MKTLGLPLNFIDYQSERLSKMDWERYKKESKERGLEIIDPKESFDKNGLKFPIEYLNNLHCFNIFFPIHKISEYCDVVTYTLVNNKTYNMLKNSIDKIDELTFYDINATGTGNAAYIYMNCDDKELKEIALYTLEHIYKLTKDYLISNHPIVFEA